MDTVLDQVILVNSHDEPIGVLDKVEAHRGQGKLHRAVSVFLFRKNAEGEVELLLQQRSQEKIVGANQWANTVCGNVRPRESYEECAYRRLEEELGIQLIGNQLSLVPLYKFHYQVNCNNEFSENEIDQIFVGWFDGKISSNSKEVRQFKWVKWNEGKIENEWQGLLAPWFHYMLKEKKILKNINKYISD